MEAAPDEEPTVFMDPVEEEIVETEHVIEEQVVQEEVVHEEVVHEEDMIQVQHEEVLEEIVEEDGLMYDTDGRVIEYPEMLYDEEAEVIEEYVEVEDMGDGRFAYVMTDEHGNRRLLKEEEVEQMKKIPGLGIMEEEVVEDSEPSTSDAGPSTSAAYDKRGRFPQTKPKQSRQQARGGQRRQPMYDVYYTSPPKGLSEMAKVDVEKYVPGVTVNRRPLPDNPVFKTKAPRSRKNPPWQDESPTAPGSRPSTSAIRPTSPSIRDPLIIPDEDVIVRFKCPECGEGFATMERHCAHMVKNHDCQTFVRDVDFFADREFENFLLKVEKATLGKEYEEGARKRSRVGTSQVFVCNYMTKGSQKDAEMVEVGMSTLAERPIEVCTAFVQKIHAYECIHVKYCDQHIHYDGNIGFRVPLAVKRRLFEMSFKRLPVPCMQAMLGIEAEELLPHPTRFEEKLKNLSHVEVVELLGIINASLRKYQEVEPKGKRIPIKFDTIKTGDGAPTLVVKRLDPPKKETMFNDKPSTSTQGYSADGEDVPAMAREEEVLDDSVIPEDCDGVMEDNFLYDPENDRDPLIEELTEMELDVLESYENDINVKLNEEQKKERIRQRTKYSLSKVVATYQTLDSATHGLNPTELHTDTINNLREMASYVVELVCQLDAEIKAQFNPNLRVEDIKRDMIAGIAMQERTYQPDRRPRKIGSYHQTPPKSNYRTPARDRDEYARRIFKDQTSPSAARQMMNVAEAFGDMGHSDRLRQLRERTLGSATGSVEPDDKPTSVPIPPIPDELKAVPWSKPQRKRQNDPSAVPKKRGRPNKKGGESTELAASKAKNPAEEETEKDQSIVEEESADTSVVAETSALEASEVPAEEAEVTVTSKVVAEEVVDVPEAVSDVVETSKEPTTAAPATAPATAPTTAPAAAATEMKEVKEEPVAAPPPTTTRTGRVVKPKKWEDN
ncbi:hypothetical protein CAEBREN_30514 [Caenorhabditis brenneri]|uniref:C2H2-type domain-containing protein n=1 Tax=Caenorhabditis brenneri TaxID=135651 RepID=G0P9A0_CAEBE|nr:hypothetical protein CAEBREN_30514 [Caenorhabditis brenneri]